MKIVTIEQIRRIDQECAREGTPTDVLMENAGRAVAEETRRILGGTDRKHILVLIGPGNNGGDGLVAARYLHDWGAGVSVYLCSPRPGDDANLALVRQRSISCLEASQDSDFAGLARLLTATNCVIDALLGTSRLRPLQGIFREVLLRVGEAKKARRGLRIIALDLPSGLDADTGAIDPACLTAEATITLAFPKLGLFCFPGAARVGRLTVADIGIPAHLADNVTVELTTREWAMTVLPERLPDANKGSLGRVLVVAGSINYIGAAYLACSGALRAGAGLVSLATPAALQPILAAKLTEVTYLPLPEAAPGVVAARAVQTLEEACRRYDVLLVGCGLGQSESAIEFIRKLLAVKERPPLVMDADALNSLTVIPDWWQEIPDNAILTPHPGEMARLCGISVAQVQADRLNLTRQKAAEWRKTVVLKGAYTVIAAADGQCRINPAANPGLASAGTGDVLSGVIAGLAAQGLVPFVAAALGAYLHGEAGDRVRDRLGDTGMIASDLLPVLPEVIRDLKKDSNLRE